MNVGRIQFVMTVAVDVGRTPFRMTVAVGVGRNTVWNDCNGCGSNTIQTKKVFFQILISSSWQSEHHAIDNQPNGHI